MNKEKPYGKLKLAFAYVKYYLRANNRHGIHSPFVYNFYTEVIRKVSKSRNRRIEKERKRLKASNQILDFLDYGKKGTLHRKKVSDIAKTSLKSKKYAQLLSQSVKYFNINNILELGTSLGVTTSYLASNSNTSVITMEGDPSVLKIAQNMWNHLGLTNIKSVEGNIDVTLDTIKKETFDFIYIDGNHKLEPTLRYFNSLLSKAHAKTVFVFDDIHYSAEMENAWNEIQNHQQTTVSIDLFFVGYVFLDPDLSKQQFELRY